MDIDRTYGQDLSIVLKPGMAYLIYFDNGPHGPCGQSMRTTCPHASLHIWNNEEEMREALKTMTPRNPKAQMMYGVVDEWSCPGIFSIYKH